MLSLGTLHANPARGLAEFEGLLPPERGLSQVEAAASRGQGLSGSRRP